MIHKYATILYRSNSTFKLHNNCQQLWVWSFIALYNWKIQNIDEQNKYPLFYFPEILTQVIVCFDQARGQMLFPLYFTKICSPMWYGKFWPVHLWTNTWTVTASEILFVDGCRLQFSGCFNKYFLPHGGLSSLPSLPDTFSIKNVYWYYKYRPEEYLIFLYIYRVVIYIYIIKLYAFDYDTNQ